MLDHVVDLGLALLAGVVADTDQQHHPLCQLEEDERVVERARGLGAPVPGGDDGPRNRDFVGNRRHDDHRPPRGEQAALDQGILTDQRIAVPRLADDGEVHVARRAGEVARELLAHALHRQPGVDAQAFGLRTHLEGLQSRRALRLHPLQRLTHVGEADIGAIKRQQRGRREGDTHQMRAVILGESDGKLDARLGRLRAVDIDDDVVKAHCTPSPPPTILALEASHLEIPGAQRPATHHARITAA